MTELAYILDPRAFEASLAQEEQRLKESTPGRDGDPSAINQEESDIDRARRLAEAGLAMVASEIGEKALEGTLGLVQRRHSNGHNHTLPNYTDEIN